MNDMTNPSSTLRINPDLDAEALAAAFRRNGQVRVASFLSHGAPELYRYLGQKDNWVHLVNHETGTHEIALTDWIAPGSEQRAEIEPGMFERACDGFQYSYSALRIPPQGETCDDPWIDGLARFMRSPSVTGFLGAVTGIESPRFTDGQVTTYGPGDFLTGHDDDLAGSGRRAAFVFGLTPQWRLEWGGLLLFHELGEVGLCGTVPQFNTLTLFAVPKYHSVSMVTQFAPRRRLSVTGWLSSK